MDSELYIGLMSGTSVDSIDAALVSFSSNGDDTNFSLVGTHSHSLPPELQKQLLNLCHLDQVALDDIGVADHQLGQEFANAVGELLAKYKVAHSGVTAIGSHGQTIRHRPSWPNQRRFTWQIGDPNIIAFESGIDTVADFRRMDFAAGGEAAPLAPMFHRAFFANAEKSRSVINIGGISNVTWLPISGPLIGFDLGPGNALMDGWIKRHQSRPYDSGGQWAQSGICNSALLEELLRHPYFKAPPPKSTGREDFHLNWLDQTLKQTSERLAAEDVQATLLELTAISIKQGLGTDYLGDEVFICGGGANNTALMKRLEQVLHPVPVAATSALGIDPDWVEACGFAWLAHQRLLRRPGNCVTVTGAQEPVILGGLYSSKART